MPIEKCSSDGNSGFRWGKQGKCYTYKSGDEKSMKEAKKKAIKQGYAENPQKFKEEMAAAQTLDKEYIQAILDTIFAMDDMEEPSEEMMICDKCQEPMQENAEKKMYECSKCGNTKEMKD